MWIPAPGVRQEVKCGKAHRGAPDAHTVTASHAPRREVDPEPGNAKHNKNNNMRQSLGFSWRRVLSHSCGLNGGCHLCQKGPRPVSGSLQSEGRKQPEKNCHQLFLPELTVTPSPENQRPTGNTEPTVTLSNAHLAAGTHTSPTGTPCQLRPHGVLQCAQAHSQTSACPLSGPSP